MFPTDYPSILKRIEAIQPKKYGQTRNFEDGAITKLSPYISRGVLSTKQIFEKILKRNIPMADTEKLFQELAWRDYWQQVWISKGIEINADLKQTQTPVQHHNMPVALLENTTGIEAIDRGILSLKQNGYLHNHMRMYVAMLHCNVSQAHWRQGAQWMYSYLLDGDWASNALSWQWVAGSNANKKYIANQENINKYFNSDQKGTYLDIPYKSFANLKIPEVLKDHKPWSLKTALPKTSNPELEQKTTLIYNYYNLDPNWHKGEDYQRLLLLEPSFFEAYPVQEHCIQFIMDLSNNIPGILLCVGEFENILRNIETEHIVFKEHPTNSHYRGKEESRDWMFSVMGYYPSFFSFWKKCKKELKNKIT